MNRPLFTLFICFCAMALRGQEDRLPADLRQHNLTTYNASLFNPAFSLGRNNPESVALWARWQWQGIDSDPSTLFLNYTRPLDNRSAAGAAFFQHNTGIFFNTGAALNYAYKFELNPRVKLAVGANVFGFVQKLADDRFQVDPNLPLPMATETNDFILQMAPGISLEIERLSLSLASENLLDYNFTAKEGNTAKEDKIFMSLLSYDFPVALGPATNAFLRPSMYLRTIPGQSNQVGFNTLLNTDVYNAQVGYNNFYGFSLGGGYTFFDRLTVGALAEFGTGASIVKESSFELMAAYFLGTPDERHKMVGHDLEDGLNPLDKIEESQQEDNTELEDKEEEKVDDKITAEEEAIAAEEKLEQEKKAAEKREKEDAKQRRKQDKMVRDSLNERKEEAEAVAKKRQKQMEKEAKERADAAEARQKSKAREESEAQKTDSIEKVESQKAIALKKEQRRKIDSVAEARAAAVRAARESEASKEEANAKEQHAAVTPEAGEKYEEVATEAGLSPGFYLIANVFGTQKYFDAFMNDLKQKGMRPKSFTRGTSGYNYVYLQRYPTIQAARAARDSKYSGKYSGNTWIFRVVGE